MKLTRSFLWSWLGITICFVSWAGPDYATHIGYAYPAGGQQGQTLEITVAGSGLKDAKAALISGDGVQVTVLCHIKNYKRHLAEQVRVMRRERFSTKAKPKKELRYGPAPEHPYFNVWQSYSDAEFKVMAQKFSTQEKVQKNKEIDELLLLRVTIEKDAKPGLRHLQITSKQGVSNPVRFMVGTLPERYEREPNDELKRVQQVLQTPFVFNGQVMPGDLDQLKFHAKKGQKLVVQAKARELIPYLADAVPGWFQAVISLKNERGEELAFVDDYQFHPDPVLYYEVGQTGTYVLSIHDAIYRGREDFVYRLSVGELPFVTSLFPLGATLGQETQVELQGWNLPNSRAYLPTKLKSKGIAKGELSTEKGLSNTFQYELSELPEQFETADNNTFAEAQNIQTPLVINGQIELPGDTDFYQFDAQQGDVIHAEILARRLNSPVDSLLRLFNADQELLQLNDDLEPAENMGLLTHHADSALSWHIQHSGRYYLQVSDSQYQGGKNYGYRLKVSELQPNFQLYALPSTLVMGKGGTSLVSFHLIRKQGFQGAVTIQATDLPTGISLSGNTIPAGVNQLDVVLKADKAQESATQTVRFTGSARIDGATVTHQATPADAQTQAFITHHLVEAEQTKLLIQKGKAALVRIKMPEHNVLALSSSQPARFAVNYAKPKKAELLVELKDAPKGVSLRTERAGKKVKFTLLTDEKAQQGMKGNLVFEVFHEITRKGKKGKQKKQRFSVGVLPAVPYEIR